MMRADEKEENQGRTNHPVVYLARYPSPRTDLIHSREYPITYQTTGIQRD
uniref:Uncharacterized protein n=1 Tax=Manihot esculenta TaxID=3983 RepID=A0A2C9URA5_MANES